MKKRIVLGFGLLLIGVSGIAGCGSSSSSDTTTTTIAPATTTTTTIATTSTSSSTTTTLSAYTISGTVKFASTDRGLNGGVTLTLSGSAAQVVTADATSGTYEVAGLIAGSYTLTPSKAGWNLTAESIVISSSSVTQDFIAFPTSWEVLRTGGSEPLTQVIMMADTNSVFAAGSDGTLLRAAAPYTSWTSISTPSNEPVVYFSDSSNSGFGIVVCDRSSTFYYSTDDGNTWTFVGPAFFPANPITSETISGAGIGSLTCFNALSTNGRAIDNRDVTIANNWRDITPASAEGIINGFEGWLAGSGVIIPCDGGRVYATVNAEEPAPSWISLGNIATVTADDLVGVCYFHNYDSLNFLGYLTSRQGSIFTSATNPAQYDNAVWQTDLSSVPFELYGIYSPTSETNRAFVVGEGGLVMRRR